MKYTCVLFCLLLPIASAPQGPAPNFTDIRKSGNLFLTMCESEHATTLDELSTHDFCHGYMAGLADSIQTSAPTCPPQEVTPPQLGRVAVKYMRDHPEGTIR